MSKGIPMDLWRAVCRDNAKRHLEEAHKAKSHFATEKHLRLHHHFVDELAKALQSNAAFYGGSRGVENDETNPNTNHPAAQ